MPIYKDFKTIPELFKIISTDFGKGKERAVLKHKVNREYVDISYEELIRQTESLALGLATLGFRRKSKLAIISENRPEWVYADMAALSLGGVDVPLYPISTADSIEFILNNSEAEGIIVSNKFQLNKVLKIRGNCKNLKYIIMMNDPDTGYGEGVYSLKQIQILGNEFKKSTRIIFGITLTSLMKMILARSSILREPPANQKAYFLHTRI